MCSRRITRHRSDFWKDDVTHTQRCSQRHSLWHTPPAALPLDVAPETKSCFNPSEGSDLAHRAAGFVESTSHDVGSFRLWPWEDCRQTVALIAEARARLTEGTMTATRFNDIETARGINCNPVGMLACERLQGLMDPVSACTCD